MKRWIALTLMLLCLLGAFARAEETSLVGQTMPDFTFTTTEGDSHSLSELLAEKDLVVLNIFTSWCPPCRMEFPEMEAVYGELGDRMEIVALSAEPEDTDAIIADYKAELGLTFPMGLISDTGLDSFIPIEGYPTTLIIDRNGNIGFFQLGMFVGQAHFRGVVDCFLAEDYDGTPVASFNAYVCDEEGEPVPGAVVNFCTDTACLPCVSDENGIITFAGKPENYHLQILKVPEGYSFDEDFEAWCDGSGDWVYVTLTKE